MLLQGCLLEYFFTPKISAGELPVDPQIETLRTAYISHCGRCHLLVAPRFFNREHPIDAFAARYVAARILTRREADDAAAYIRILAINAEQPAAPPTGSPLPIDPAATPVPGPTLAPTATPSPTALPGALPTPAASPVP